MHSINQVMSQQALKNRLWKLIGRQQASSDNQNQNQTNFIEVEQVFSEVNFNSPVEQSSPQNNQPSSAEKTLPMQWNSEKQDQGVETHNLIGLGRQVHPKDNNISTEKMLNIQSKHQKKSQSPQPYNISIQGTPELRICNPFEIWQKKQVFQKTEKVQQKINLLKIQNLTIRINLEQFKNAYSRELKILMTDFAMNLSSKQNKYKQIKKAYKNLVEENNQIKLKYEESNKKLEQIKTNLERQENSKISDNGQKPSEIKQSNDKLYEIIFDLQQKIVYERQNSEMKIIHQREFIEQKYKTQLSKLKKQKEQFEKYYEELFSELQYLRKQQSREQEQSKKTKSYNSDIKSRLMQLELWKTENDSTLALKQAKIRSLQNESFQLKQRLCQVPIKKHTKQLNESHKNILFMKQKQILENQNLQLKASLSVYQKIINDRKPNLSTKDYQSFSFENNPQSDRILKPDLSEVRSQHALKKEGSFTKNDTQDPFRQRKRRAENIQNTINKKIQFHSDYGFKNNFRSISPARLSKSPKAIDINQAQYIVDRIRRKNGLNLRQQSYESSREIIKKVLQNRTRNYGSNFRLKLKEKRKEDNRDGKMRIIEDKVKKLKSQLKCTLSSRKY